MDHQVRDPEIESEQAYLGAAYARLESMRRRPGGAGEPTPTSARRHPPGPLERDIAYDITQRRLADLDIGEAPLCFGRLDLETGATRTTSGASPSRTPDHPPLVIDWQHVAEPFYRATAIAPMGVVRRRHFITRHGCESRPRRRAVSTADARPSRPPASR